MDAPDAATIRTLLPPTLNLGGYGYAPPVPPATADPLAPFVDVAVALLPEMIGYTLGTVPAAKEPLVRMVIAGLALRSALDLTPDRLETLADFDLLASFSAGSYSETRRSADDAEKIQKLGLTGWPWLDFLLRQAMSPEKLEELQALILGINPPADAVTEVAWGIADLEDELLLGERPFGGWGGTDPRLP
jgi:hypothetical protein